MIYLITGGQRSGKSVYAEQLALNLSPNPIYIATAHIWDEEFRARVKKHQERRGNQWTNIEEERKLSRYDVTGQTILIDCCTLWATNVFFDHESDNDNVKVQNCLDELKTEFDLFTSQEATFIFVTNEIGLGGISENKLQRQFTDLIGLFNQYVAAKADNVTLIISGIAINIKS